MNKISIIPTADTSFGIDDRYDIKDVDGVILYENVKQSDLLEIVSSNKYSIISGEKYL